MKYYIPTRHENSEEKVAFTSRHDLEIYALNVWGEEIEIAEVDDLPQGFDVMDGQPKHTYTKMNSTDQSFKLLNDLTYKLAELDVITDDGDRDATDAKVWAALNTLREELQNALIA